MSMGANIYRSIAVGIISLCFLYIGYVLIKTKNTFLVHRYNIILIPLKYRKEFTKRAGIGICIMAAVTLIYSVLIILFSDSFFVADYHTLIRVYWRIIYSRKYGLFYDAWTAIDFYQ